MDDQRGLLNPGEVCADVGVVVDPAQRDRRLGRRVVDDLAAPAFDVFRAVIGHAQVDKAVKRGGIVVLQALQKRVRGGIQAAIHHAIHHHQAADARWIAQGRAQGSQRARRFRRQHTTRHAVRVQHGKYVVDQVVQRDRVEGGDAGAGAPVVVTDGAPALAQGFKRQRPQFAAADPAANAHNGGRVLGAIGVAIQSGLGG